ncbi:hypothetical protein WJX73_009055 [Symbiochloris irregularis]|uniref:Succinate dehydrogenase assembly factor 2, mitochondrial n=1 Tax=Symbiochloris irregularis TaxID=706552 RepID=A0AAW1PS57_9CHLO
MQRFNAPSLLLRAWTAASARLCPDQAAAASLCSPQLSDLVASCTLAGVRPPAVTVTALSSLRHFASSTNADAQGHDSEERRKEVHRLLYRAKQRGFLELDLLVGSWAEAHVPQMDPAALQHFQEVLVQENPDMFKWLTGQAPAPPEMLHNPVFKELQGDVQQQLQKRQGQTAAQPGRQWLPVVSTGATQSLSAQVLE